MQRQLVGAGVSGAALQTTADIHVDWDIDQLTETLKGMRGNDA